MQYCSKKVTCKGPTMQVKGMGAIVNILSHNFSPTCTRDS